MGLMIDLQPGFGRALVVGGGQVAARKVRTLAEAEFETVVVAPEVIDEIRHKPHVTMVERAFAESDLDGFAVVIAATRDRDLNRRIGQLCRKRGTPVLVADRQEESTFFTPAVIRDEGLAIAVSTGGASPAIAKAIRERIVAALGPNWGSLLRMARSERQERLERERE